MEVNRRTSTLLFFLLFSILLQRPTSALKQSYIVYLGEYSQAENGASLTQELKEESHYDLLGSILGSKEKARECIFYSYTEYINGFATNLEEKDAIEMSKRSDVVGVIPDRVYKLHTTRSWELVGLEKDGEISHGSIWEKARYGEDVIIATLDTGVWHESQSFNDNGMGPIPSRWKGQCDKGVTCNRKLIGARYFNKGFLAAGGSKDDPNNYSPHDTEGHGTHTLSTAAGRFVPNANFFGYANGTAKGGSPNARVASYKVCWPAGGSRSGGCSSADMLAGFEAAIHDGVDVLSVSLGGFPKLFIGDALAIGSFHAVKNGIAVVCSGGNDGPHRGTASNLAPWMLTVGASTVDREFATYLTLSNKVHIQGQGLSDKLLKGFKPIISAADAVSPTNTTVYAQFCLASSLDPFKVVGKIVICLRGVNGKIEKGFNVKEAGGVGMILANDIHNGNEMAQLDAHLLPAIQISYSDAVTVFSYLDSTKSPYGSVTRAKLKLGVKPSPVMAAFSSQGPNLVIPEILKPDITAPGVSILAAFTGARSPTNLPFDARRVPFNFLSGTSMSCPHISGIVGLLKSLHPDWSPSAIKSAIMTTATTLDNTGQPIKNASLAQATPFGYGSGHVKANRAMDPGLVYDLAPGDYLNFLCSIGYNSSERTLFNGEPYLCPSKPSRVIDLNLPSINIPNLTGPTTVTRVLKNVGSPGTYKAFVKAPPGIEVSVKPASLDFGKVGEEKKFEVTLSAKKNVKDYVFGTLTWSDGKHDVRSPIVVRCG